MPERRTWSTAKREVIVPLLPCRQVTSSNTAGSATRLGSERGAWR
ncbi:hypothetical protein ACIG54_36235 [Streptomyces achromogenes]